MILKSCARCGNLIPYGKAYCEACAEKVQAEREKRIAESIKASNKRYNQRRDPKYTTFYRSQDWRKLARTRIQMDGYRCVMCGEFATEVDHIKPIQTPEGWEMRLDLNNTQSLCTRCHNAKHNRFQKKNNSGKPQFSKNFDGGR